MIYHRMKPAIDNEAVLIETEFNKIVKYLRDIFYNEWAPVLTINNDLIGTAATQILLLDSVTTHGPMPICPNIDKNFIVTFPPKELAAINYSLLLTIAQFDEREQMRKCFMFF